MSQKRFEHFDLFRNRLNNYVEWSTHPEYLKITKSIGHVSLCRLRRLTWVDTFRKCIKPPFHRTRLICLRHSLFTTPFRILRTSKRNCIENTAREKGQQRGKGLNERSLVTISSSANFSKEIGRSHDFLLLQ